MEPWFRSWYRGSHLNNMAFSLAIMYTPWLLWVVLFKVVVTCGLPVGNSSTVSMQLVYPGSTKGVELSAIVISLITFIFHVVLLELLVEPHRMVRFSI